MSPKWAKGYSHLGAALRPDNQLAEAMEAFITGLQLDPKDEYMQDNRMELKKDLDKE